MLPSQGPDMKAAVTAAAPAATPPTCRLQTMSASLRAREGVAVLIVLAAAALLHRSRGTPPGRRRLQVAAPISLAFLLLPLLFSHVEEAAQVLSATNFSWLGVTAVSPGGKWQPPARWLDLRHCFHSKRQLFCFGLSVGWHQVTVQAGAELPPALLPAAGPGVGKGRRPALQPSLVQRPAGLSGGTCNSRQPSIWPCRPRLPAEPRLHASPAGQDGSTGSCLQCPGMPGRARLAGAGTAV